MRVGLILAILLGIPFALLGFAIALGGPLAPQPMASISDPFRNVDFSSLPPLVRFDARDGKAIAYRTYPPTSASPKGTVILIHGSSAKSDSMHPLATALARAGFTAYALDVRGHGESGAKGRIAYVGQLEDDLEDFLKAVGPPHPRVLLGFSSGGGFALRFAGGDRQKLFDRYILLSPFIHQDAATYRPAGGGWVAVGVPRIVGLTLLNRLGIKLFNDLPVTAFALNAAERELLTPSYSFSLASNFRPHDEYRTDLRRAMQPMEVLVGQGDEVFRAERFAAVFEQAGRPLRVTIVPGVSHIGLTLQPAGIEATMSAVGSSAVPTPK